MRFVCGYAGIPSEIYDEIRAARARFCGEGVSFLSVPLRTNDWYPKYTESHTNSFLKGFGALIRNDHQNALSDTGFALLYIRHDDVSTETFVGRFFPSTMCIEIPWALDRTNDMTMRQSKNELITLLREATEQVRKAIPPLKKEIRERDARTPLLLPLKNFHSDLLVDEIKNLQEALVDEDDKLNVIVETVRTLERHHPLQAPTKGYRKFFLDERNVQFRPPGTAGSRHGFARGHGRHPETCLLSGRRRLGAPYDPVFHYDCQKGTGNIHELFYGCHEEQAMLEGDPHLNVSPNDHVRGATNNNG